MKEFFAFVVKEFSHVFRDKKTLLMLFGVPIVQIVLFGFALTNEIKNSNIVIVDNAKDLASQQIITKIASTDYFKISRELMNSSQIDAAFKSGHIKLAIVIPENFYTDLLHTNKAQIQIIADASDPNTGTTLTNYVSGIIADYNTQLNEQLHIPEQINLDTRMLYNPDLKGAPNFVPGVIAMVMLLICVMMTSISIVREKELGTMEILLVSPFKPIYVILSKAVPYLALSIINLTVILLLSVYALDLPIKGSLVLLYAMSILYIITSLSLGLLVSTGSSTQQGAMSLSLVGMMLPTMMLSGYVYPIENMPLPLRVLSNIVPAKWYYIIVKDIMLKGLGFSYIWKETLILSVMTVFFLALSLRNFKIRLE
ncbi:MAG: ABC transporter permease [Bacteroidia bacterium]